MLIDGIFCSAWFHFAARSGGNWCHIRRRWFPLRVTHLRHCEARHNQGHSAAVDGVKSRGSVVEKNRKGAIFLRRPTRAIDSKSWKVFPRLLSCPTFVNCVLTAQRSKKVEFSARRVGTNGLNSLQLSLDKLKTNTCSRSKHMVTQSVSFFPKDKQKQ